MVMAHVQHLVELPHDFRKDHDQDFDTVVRGRLLFINGQVDQSVLAARRQRGWT
jgi:hypothetical protein